MCSLISFSNSLQTTDVKLTGLLFSELLLDPFLNNGMIFASLHSNGTTHSSIDKLNTVASGMLICLQFPVVIWEESHPLQVTYYDHFWCYS